MGGMATGGGFDGGGPGLFAMLLIGLIAGWVAEKVTASRHGLFTNLVVGALGAYIGGTIARMLRLDFAGFMGHLIVATVGAILVLTLWRRITAR
jgi:uncharacterized membrane protein YeaQ/YmgE (transglycosylase-associated protein family)